MTEVLRYLDDDYYQFGVIPAIYPLKGTEFAEMYCDFKSHIVEIPGTEFNIRRDDYIYSEDPVMREFQIRFIEGVDEAVEKFIEENEVRHANAASLAYFKCMFATKLVQELKEEVKDGDVQWSTDNTAGAGRIYAEKAVLQKNNSYRDEPSEELRIELNTVASIPGDESRHKLV